MPENAKAPENAIHLTTREEWRAWLAQNYTRAQGIWLISDKRATGRPRIEYEDAVEEALCFGWIDGQASTLDEQRGMQWFAPRKPGSTWAKSNKERVARLIAEGRMTPAGLAKIEAARQDGSWNTLDDLAALGIPPDLQAALDASPPAGTFFENFPPSVKQNILYWIYVAKRPETRRKRIEETARLAAQNIRANQRQP
jgi:uncharacterized protein YdeI (YjbR/CyaY-like superfamily)